MAVSHCDLIIFRFTLSYQALQLGVVREVVDQGVQFAQVPVPGLCLKKLTAKLVVLRDVIVHKG